MKAKACHLNDKRMVGVVDDEIHAGKTYHFVKLVATLVDTSVFRGECPHLKFLAVNPLWDVAAEHRHWGVREIR